jgi:hypothetical protein
MTWLERTGMKVEAKDGIAKSDCRIAVREPARALSESETIRIAKAV